MNSQDIVSERGDERHEPQYPIRKRPLEIGFLWTDTVAEYLLDVYPGLLEDGYDLEEILNVIQGA